MSDANGLGTWVSFDKVAFHAGTNPGPNPQVIFGSTPTTVSFGQGINWFNVGGAYNSSTYSFTPPVPGVYQLNCHISYTAASLLNTGVQLWISSPGGWVAREVGPSPPPNTAMSLNLSAVINSSITPGPYYVQVVYNTSNSNFISILPYDSHFSGCLLFKN